MGRRWTMWGLVVVLAALLGIIAWRIGDERSGAARAERVRAGRARRDRQRLQERSGELMPDAIRGVALGMRVADVSRARPAMSSAARQAEEPELALYEENLENGARAVYAFERESGRLQRVQLLSLLPDTSAIAPHLRAMNDRYGRPTGMWDCPNTGGVPTRRFTWRHGPVTVSDVFLIYGGRVSVTFYLAATDVIGRSLERSECRPLTDLEHFPVASPADVVGGAR